MALSPRSRQEQQLPVVPLSTGGARKKQGQKKAPSCVTWRVHPSRTNSLGSGNSCCPHQTPKPAAHWIPWISGYWNTWALGAMCCSLAPTCAHSNGSCEVAEGSKLLCFRCFARSGLNKWHFGQQLLGGVIYHYPTEPLAAKKNIYT